MQHCDTGHLAPERQASYFRDLLCEHAGRHGSHSARAPEVRALSRAPGTGLRGQLTVGDLHDIRFCRLRAGPHRFTGIVPPDAVVILQLSGRTQLSQEGPTLSVRPGQWIASGRGGLLTIENSTTVDQLVVYLPSWRARSARRDTYLFGSSRGLERLTYEFVLSTYHGLAELEASAAAHVAEMVATMISRTIDSKANDGPQLDAPAGSIEADDIRLFVERNVRDQELSLELIARTFTCSKRTIQRRFEAAFGQSVTRYIWRARLEQCAREVGNSRSLTELAHSYGFASSAHFSRAFRSHFGVSPSTLRSKTG